jgi:hypothetical protein
MYVCVYMYMYMYVCVCLFVCVYVCVCVCAFVGVCVSVCVGKYLEGFKYLGKSPRKALCIVASPHMIITIQRTSQMYLCTPIYATKIRGAATCAAATSHRR